MKHLIPILGLALLLVGSAAAIPMTTREYQQVLRDLRSRDGLNTEIVAAALEDTGTINGSQALYLYLTLEDKFTCGAGKKSLANILQQKWARGMSIRQWQEERSLAYMHLQAASCHSSITPTEIEAARQSMEASNTRYARMVLRIVSRFPAFSDAVRAGREEDRTAPPPNRLNIERISKILSEHYDRDVTFVDSNRNGVVDANDQARPRGRLGEALANKVLIQKGLVDAVFKLVDDEGRVRIQFKLVHETHFDRDLFRPDSRSFVLKRGVLASEALDGLFADAESYGMECATAISIIHYSAIRDAYLAKTGNDDLFNDRFRDMRIGQLGMGTENDLRRARQRIGGPLKIGDHGYFSTPDVDPLARQGGWNGENVIFLGDDLYFGHPFGVSDSATIISHLNSVRIRGLRNPRPATLNQGAYRILPASLFN